LEKSGYYTSYKHQYHTQKLRKTEWYYNKTSGPLRSEFRALIRENMTDEDRNFYRTASRKSLSGTARRFGKMLDGDLWATVSYHVCRMAKMPEELCRQWIFRPLRRWWRAA
jgi:hypothetical protein